MMILMIMIVVMIMMTSMIMMVQGPGFDDNDVSNEVENVMTIALFGNLQKQIVSLLNDRREFIEGFSNTISSELDILRQTVNLLQQIVNFKIEQSGNDQ